MTQPKSIILTLISILVNGLFRYCYCDGNPTPVVMYHGMGDTAHGSLDFIQKYLEQKLPGIHVNSIQMGKNAMEDFYDSYFKPLNEQVDEACKIIQNDQNLTNGYNAIGFSQGGQILRAIAQRCPSPPMLNLISIGGQHQGVFGFPKCYGDNNDLCDYVRKLISIGVYTPMVQNRLVQAQYWHDPRREDEYRETSIFLADINNERVRNTTYKDNLTKLRKFVMVKFLNETIVEPKESEWFGFYYPDSGSKVETLQESKLYKEDWLGLQQMDKNGQLVFLSVEGDHLQFTVEWFQSNIVDRYLK